MKTISKFDFLQAVIFVDNAGSDVVLGILPFARELLRRGTKVWNNKHVLSFSSVVCCFSGPRWLAKCDAYFCQIIC